MRFHELFEAVLTHDNAALKQLYDAFNRRLFDSKLPEIPVEYAKLKTVGGIVHTKVRRIPGQMIRSLSRYSPATHEIVPGSMRLQISSIYQREETAIHGLLVHEMIHVWVIAVEHDYNDDHGPKFLAKRRQLASMVNFDIPLTDSVTGLQLTTAATRKVGAILQTKPGKITIAVMSEAYMRQHLEAMKERWTYFVKHKYADDIKFIITHGKLESVYPIQRKKQFSDISFYIVKDQSLLDEALANAEVLAILKAD
jgi:hypothetical protein